jgi:hypothetical protein
MYKNTVNKIPASIPTNTVMSSINNEEETE